MRPVWRGYVSFGLVTIPANAARINPAQAFTNQFVDQAHKTLGF